MLDIRKVKDTGKDRIVVVDIGNNSNRFEKTVMKSADPVFDLIKIDDTGIKCYYIRKTVKSSEKMKGDESDASKQTAGSGTAKKDVLNIPLRNYWSSAKKDELSTSESNPAGMVKEDDIETLSDYESSGEIIDRTRVFTKNPGIIEEQLKGAGLVIVVCEVSQFMMGTVAMDVIKTAKRLEILTIVIATDAYENKALQGKLQYDIRHFRKEADAVFEIWDEDSCLNTGDPYDISMMRDHRDDYIRDLVNALTETFSENGIINLDITDLKTVIGDRKDGYIGFGTGEGEKKALQAARKAIKMCHLGSAKDDVSQLIINFNGDMGIPEVNAAVQYIHGIMPPGVIIIFGLSEYDCEEECTVLIIAMK